jgi:lysophospholipase L1-like esterase
MSEPPRPKLIHRIAGTIGGLAFASLLFGGVLEVGLRIHNPVPLRQQGAHMILAPNQDFERESPMPGDARLEPKAHVVTNALGLRARPLPPEGSSAIKLVTVGGSTTENRFASNERAWPGRFEALMTPALPALYVANAGLDGNSTFGHRQLLAQIVLPKLKPDYVVLLVGMNDAALSEPTPFDGDTLRETGARSLIRSSVLLDTARTLYRSWKASRAGVSYRGKAIDFAAEPKLHIPEPQLVAMIEQQAPAVAGYRARLEAIIEQIQATGAQVVLCTQPSLYGDVVDPTSQVALGDLQVTARAGVAMPATNAKIRARSLELYNDTTRDVAAKRGLVLVDLDRVVPKDSRYYIDWIHYSLEGNELVARELARVLGPRLVAAHGGDAARLPVVEAPREVGTASTATAAPPR